MRAVLVAILVIWHAVDLAQADIIMPPESGYASDAWLDGSTPWAQERERREAELVGYLNDANAERAKKYGFRPGHHPRLAWAWFDQHPVGFNGVPNVLLQTFLSLDPATEKDRHLKELANIWRKASALTEEAGRFTLDHLGAGPHSQDYADGTAKAPAARQHPLPNGFVFDPTVKPETVRRVRTKLLGQRVLKFKTLFFAKVRKHIHDRIGLNEIDYETEVHKLQEPPKIDAVFFACSACHVGRVIVDGAMDRTGNKTKQGKVKFLYGMPNTEIEAQHYSELLLATGLALIESGFAIDFDGLPDPDDIEVRRKVVKALFVRMIDRARDEDTVTTIYGAGRENIERARVQTHLVAKDFAVHVAKLIGTAVKTQFIYHQIGGKFGFNKNNPLKATADQKVPHLLNNRPGQMDAFGIASGLVAIHTARQDQSYIKFLKRNWPNNPLFTGIATAPGFESPATVEELGRRIMANLDKWAPPVPAPIDIKSLNWAAQRRFANWDGNQGAAARALASGTSATGNPLDTNVRIHEPLNPFINFLPPPAYPFEIDRDKARRGKSVFQGEGCAGCHRPGGKAIFPAARLGVDDNRSRLTKDVSRYGLAGLVMEACNIFMRKNPGNDWCLPRDQDGKVVTDIALAYDDYFKDTPGRVRDGKNGYKADMLHGIWARAPFLHNGSVPTLLQLMCPDTRPKRFKRGIIYYDREMVGFEWNIVPKQRYSQHDVINVKSFDTAEFGRSNGGHNFAADRCPDTTDLDPVADRQAIVERVLASEIGDLLEYMKTF